jgi:hypothetical protein
LFFGVFLNSNDDVSLVYPWRLLKESFAANRSDMFIQSIPSHVQRQITQQNTHTTHARADAHTKKKKFGKRRRRKMLSGSSAIRTLDFSARDIFGSVSHLKKFRLFYFSPSRSLLLLLLLLLGRTIV